MFQECLGLKANASFLYDVDALADGAAAGSWVSPILHVVDLRHLSRQMLHHRLHPPNRFLVSVTDPRPTFYNTKSEQMCSNIIN